MILNHANAVYIGARAANAVYRGHELIWSNTFPIGYTWLKGIESSSKQYLDTGLKGDQNTKIRCVFENTKYVNAAASIFGSRRSPTVDSINCMFGTIGDVQLDWYDYSETRIQTAQVVALHTRVEVFVSAEKSSIRTEAEYVERTTPYIKAFKTPSTIQVFRTNTQAKALPHMILREFDMWDGDIHLAHFIPCIAPNGAIGCYDTNREIFIGNAGSGTFTAVYS